MLPRSVLAVLLTFLAITAQAVDVVTPDSAVTINVPDDFTPLSADEIKKKWSTSASPPTFVVGNKSRSTSIAYDLKANKLKFEDLPQAMKTFEAVFTRIVPGISWKRREIIEIIGRKWVILEFTSSAIDADIYNIILITSYRGRRMLALNFNSTNDDFAKMESSLRHSIASIKLNET